MTSLARFFPTSTVALGSRQSRPCRLHSSRPATYSPVVAPVVCTAATSRTGASVQHLPNTVPVTFSIQLEVPFGDHLRLVGNAPALGNWKVDTAPRLEWAEDNVWTVTLDCVPLKPLEFKFVHMKRDGTQVWENCGNRQFTPVVLGVSSEWNQPVVHALPSAFAAELEARALVVQAVEVLELLDSALEFNPYDEALKSEVAAAGTPAQQQQAQHMEAQHMEEQQEVMRALELELEQQQQEQEQEVAAALQATAASEEPPAVAGVIPAPQLAEYAEALVQAAAAFQQAGLLRLNGLNGAAAPAADVAAEPALADAGELVDAEAGLQHTVDAGQLADAAIAELAAAELAAAGQPLAPADTEDTGAAIQELPAPEVAAAPAAPGAAEDASLPVDLEAEFQAASAGMAVLLPEGDAPEAPNGAALNGTAPSGAEPNGKGLNGALINGAAANGAAINGTTPANGEVHDSDAAASSVPAVALQAHKAGAAVEGKAASTGGRRGYSTEYQRYLAESEGAARWEELLETMRSGSSRS